MKVSFGDIPQQERDEIAAGLTQTEIDARISRAQQALQNDKILGAGWAFCYLVSFYMFGLSPGTIVIFSLGIIYFLQAFIRKNWFGLNKKRISVYQELRSKH